MEECKRKGFDIKECNIDILLRKDMDNNKETYLISFYPRKVTPENVMEYKLLLDDLTVYIDAETKTVIHSCPGI